MSSRIILITGGNSGLGLATARTFLGESQDNFVWLGVHTHRDKADSLAVEYSARCSCVALDVTQPAAWRSAVTQILSAQKRIDVLINNAGIHQDGLLANLS